ncbi:gamma-glutamyltransferase family protein [Caenispirillum salinarum]|uniref:gamma-glutamyltransferase family protein n=1 Tax=Caenispirillum salinarum TaxID=859058 RepID=UPI00384AA282
MTASPGLVVAPHARASEAGAAILREGGTAVEALVAASAVCAAVWPHMTGLGGDGVWLLAGPDDAAPAVVESIGRAGEQAGALAEILRAEGLTEVPARGPRAALTAPGTVAGWARALRHEDAGRLPLSRLFAEAVDLARDGVAVSPHLAEVLDRLESEAASWPGFAQTVERTGGTLRQPALAATLERLAEAGLADFYSGETARALASDLAVADCPLTGADLSSHAARMVGALALRSRIGSVYAPPPPTQGLTALMMLGLFDRLQAPEPDGFDHWHGLIEAAKQAVLVREAVLADPDTMSADAASFLGATDLAMRASDIVPNLALGWPVDAAPGDTVFLAAIDDAGRMACTLQSLYAEFGSGVVSPQTGVILHNRAAAFALDAGSPRAVAPGRLPPHTLSPVMAVLKDGRRMMAGAAGGDAQPQAVAQILARHLTYRQPLDEAMAAPRFRLGKDGPEDADDVKLENGADPRVVEALRAAGHAVRMIAAPNALTGQAGAVVRHPDGRTEGAADPRAEGSVAEA